jgi:hypothetical protein
MSGRGDPPKEHRFSSTNQPKKQGRKKGSKNFKTIFKHFLKKNYTRKELEKVTGKKFPFLDTEKNYTLQEAIVLSFLKKALVNPDHKDLKAIMDRVDGLLTKDVNLHHDIIDEEKIQRAIERIAKRPIDEKIN